jgi:hypothetical protein
VTKINNSLPQGTPSKFEGQQFTSISQHEEEGGRKSISFRWYYPDQVQRYFSERILQNAIIEHPLCFLTYTYQFRCGSCCARSPRDHRRPEAPSSYPVPKIPSLPSSNPDRAKMSDHLILVQHYLRERGSPFVFACSVFRFC